MAKKTETKAAAPKTAKAQDKTTTKKSAKSKSKVAGLSEERIVDSESEGDTPAVKLEIKSPKPVKGKDKKEKKSATISAPAPPPPKKEPTPSSSDDSSEEESADEDEEMADAPALKKPDTVPVKVNGVKRKAESVSSLEDGESSDDETSDDDAKPDAKRVKTALKDAGEVEQVGEVASSGDEETDSESEGQKEDEQEPSADTAPAPRAAQHVNLENIPVQPFRPPNGYRNVDVTDVTFSAKSFAGQQIWHIVAPRNVSLKSISDVALDAISSGATVLTHKGTEYSLSEDTSTKNQCFSVAVPSNTSYHGIPQPISRTLYIKQKVTLPNLSKKQADVNTGSSAAADVAQPSISDIRPQPKGMRMRYKPAGFGPGDPGLGSDSEEDGGQAKANGSKLQFPKTIGAHGAAVEAQNADKPQTKKTKKDRGDSKGELSKEEKKKLKGEKKARKEAKAAKAT